LANWDKSARGGSLSDEEWIDFGDELTDQDLAARYRKYFAMEI